MKTAFEKLLIDCMTAQGQEQGTAELTAAFVVKVGVSAGVIRRDDLDAFDRNSTVYTLAGQKVPISAITARLHINKATIYRILRGHQRRLGEVYKLRIA